MESQANGYGVEVINPVEERHPSGAQEALKALTVSQQADALTISDKPTYERGRELLLTVKDLRKQIADTFKPIIEKAFAAHREAIAQQKKVENPLIRAEELIKARISTFLIEEERLRKLKEARLRKIAEAEAEERRLADALAAEAEGDTEEAQAILDEEPAFIPPPIVARTVETGGGIAMKTNWKFRINDASKIPREFLAPDLVKIGGYVRSMKEAAKIPGVDTWAEGNIAAGRRS
jgi:hypothetical protein